MTTRYARPGAACSGASNMRSRRWRWAPCATTVLPRTRMLPLHCAAACSYLAPRRALRCGVPLCFRAALDAAGLTRCNNAFDKCHAPFGKNAKPTEANGEFAAGRALLEAARCRREVVVEQIGRLVRCVHQPVFELCQQICSNMVVRRLYGTIVRRRFTNQPEQGRTKLFQQICSVLVRNRCSSRFEQVCCQTNLFVFVHEHLFGLFRNKLV